MKNLRVGKKLIAAFAVVLILFAAVMVAGLSGIRSIQAEIKEFYSGPYAIRNIVNSMQLEFERSQEMFFRAISTNSIEATDEAVKASNASGEAVQALMETLKGVYRGDPALIGDLEQLLTQIKPHREKALALANANKNRDASEYMESNNLPLINRATEKLAEISTETERSADETMKQIAEEQAFVLVLMCTMGGACVAVVIVLCLLLTRGLTRPIAEIEAAAEKMTRGSLNADIQYESRDELGKLSNSMRFVMTTLSGYVKDIDAVLGQVAGGNLTVGVEMEYVGDFASIKQSINRILISLNETLGQINRASEEVASGSGQVSCGAQALSKGAIEQAGAVQQLAGSISEVSEQIKENAQTAQEGSLQIAETGKAISDCNAQMEQMVTAMQRISDSSGKIGKIIKTIEDIAFQTNILALNAAVEAARAGAAGKGFAVVADEVRNLAGKSADAAQNTTALIVDSLRAVEDGSRIADSTQNALREIVECATKATASMEKITSDSNGQADAVARLARGVEQISDVVRSNSATAEESAAASEELSGQARMLKGLVGRFLLEEENKTMLQYTVEPESGTSEKEEY